MAQVHSDRSPFRVKLRSPGAQAPSQLCPNERTWSAETVRSAKCQIRTHAPQ